MEAGVSGAAAPEPAAPLLRACARLPVERTPVWFMRQAGRALPEYRAVRARHSLLEICAQPELAVEVTLQPVRRLGVDAAILFADILLPLIPMGVELEFAPGEGPVIHTPLRGAAELARLRPLQAEADLPAVLETVRGVRAALPPEVALIGFAGAPFTLACYLIEGGGSRDFARARALMYGEPGLWHRLLERLAAAVADYLTAQVRAGAQVVQLFDSWAGALAPDDYREFVQPHSAAVLAAVAAAGAPSIHFGTGTAMLLEAMRDAGGDVIGVDWRVPLDQAWDRLGPGVAVQGNLDPAALLAPLPALEQQVRRVLDQAGGRPGHIFNLGHGVLPQTPPEALAAVVEWVHAAAPQAVAR